MKNIANLVAELQQIVEPKYLAPLNSRLIVRPASAPDISKILDMAARAKVPVHVGVPAAPPAESQSPSIVIDLGRMTTMLHLDETSLLLHVQTGISLGCLEDELKTRDLTIGSLPSLSRQRLLGAALAAPYPAEANPRGRLLDACLAVDVVLADGTLIATHMAPRKATGPEVSHAFLAARGRSGVLTAAWLRLERRGPAHEWFGFVFDEEKQGFTNAWSLARRMLSSGARPARLEILSSDAATPVLGSEAIGPGKVGLLIELEGVEEMVAAGRELARSLGGALAAGELKPALVEKWLSTGPAEKQHEGFVTTPLVEEAWKKRGPLSWITAIRPAGVALLSNELPSPSASPLSAAHAALYARLDPLSLFADGEI